MKLGGNYLQISVKLAFPLTEETKDLFDNFYDQYTSLMDSLDALGIEPKQSAEDFLMHTESEEEAKKWGG